MTACKDCVHHRQWILYHYCVAAEETTFDYLTGQTLKVSDLNKFPTQLSISCKMKNMVGNCADFEALVKEINDEDDGETIIIHKNLKI